MPSATVARHRDALLESWFERLLAGYPEQTATFLRGRTDPFHNPVGTGLRTELGRVLDGLIAGSPAADLTPSLDQMIRIRAVQDMAPSRATGFVLELKRIVRAVVGHDLSTAEQDSIDRWIDDLLLVAFDVYARCREQVFDIRVLEIRNRSMKVMERLNAWRKGRAGAAVEPAAAP